MKSESTGKIAEALSKAQGELKPARRDTINPFFKSKYADLASILEVCRKPLADNGLAVSQLLRRDFDGVTILETILLHSSNEWLSSDYPVIPIKNDPQGQGSALSYARRYSLSAILGVATDEDDDGEIAMDRKPVTKTETEKITPEQYKQIVALLTEKGIAPSAVKEYIKTIFKKANSQALTSKEAAQLTDDILAGKLIKEVPQQKKTLESEARKLGNEE